LHIISAPGRGTTVTVIFPPDRLIDPHAKPPVIRLAGDLVTGPRLSDSPSAG
jgi:hypothetical protein